MGLDYQMIGKRIAKRYGYLSSIERAVSIPSTEVIMRLAIALETTPDEFLVGTARQEGEEWRNVAELLRSMDGKQLALAKSFLTWLSEQAL